MAALSSRPPPICPFARPVAAQSIRGRRTKTTKAQNAPGHPKPSSADVSKIMSNIKKMEEDDSDIRPLSDKELESDDIPVINWWEQDLDREGTPRRFIERLATPKDRKKDKEMLLMIEESYKNPEYDDAKLNRRLIDSLISNPNFADLTQDLKDMKEDIKSKAELEAEDERATKSAEREFKQFSANLRMATHQALQDLIDDPDIGDAAEELREVQANIPEMDGMDNPDFQAMLQKASAKLEGNEALQKKMKAVADKSSDFDFEKEWEAIERTAEEDLDDAETDEADYDIETPEGLQDIDKLLHQMRDVIKSMGSDSGLESELDAVLNEDPEAEQEGDLEREMDPEELAEELTKLAQSKASQAPEIEPDEEDIPAELQAKVDKIMEDPKLMEKLMYIQKLIAESEQAQKADLTTIAHETAPDPYELEESRTATLKERMDKVRQDPEHRAALQRLRVNLPPPFNISPALKSFNQAIELAYVGANDDIRRILWRAYQKARTLPTFLQSMSDDAWDILYYSQAVTWSSNQNRQSHLRTMLADLKRLGRDGPPTHPSTLVQRGEGEHLES
ncbi:hypothetical protein N0V83_005266 [Neocucurbitaria cava]|uniref:Uncharacterized protein n=1 Tax=Neocucurbitaria cava TaxID=798079 RepID=A0A9W8Y981_9PLEO|nr:hypothetical protein N0V83_005266 [Neocucurbitaria cava]